MAVRSHEARVAGLTASSIVYPLSWNMLSRCPARAARNATRSALVIGFRARQTSAGVAFIGPQGRCSSLPKQRAASVSSAVQ